MKRPSLDRLLIASLGMLLCAATGRVHAGPAQEGARCGEAITLQTREGSTTRYAYVPPATVDGNGGPVTLVLLPGGSGHVDLDDKGCPRALTGNSLVRSIPTFNAAGFGTALVDAPSDYQTEDGLGGFRTDPRHAEDLGKLIAGLRARTGGAVWVVGTSRGSISAANAAARLSGPAAPDGVVLTSALMSGQAGARKTWVVQTVFDLPLEDIRRPLLLVGHAADKCVRSPPQAMEKIMARVSAKRRQLVTVTGGPAYEGPSGLLACEGRSPHGFVDQEAELAAGIGRFVRGGTY